MSQTYDVYQGQPESEGGQEWLVLVEYSNQGQAKPPTKIKFMPDRHATREEARVEAERQAFDFSPPDPLSPKGRKVYSDGDGFLTIIEGAMSTFHFSTRVVRFRGEGSG